MDTKSRPGGKRHELVRKAGGRAVVESWTLMEMMMVRDGKQPWGEVEKECRMSCVI